MIGAFCGDCGRLLGSRDEECAACRGDTQLYCPKCNIDISVDDMSCSYCGTLFFHDADEREADKKVRMIRSEKDEELVCVETFLNRIDIELAAGLLESFGIWSLAKIDDCGGLRPHLIYGSEAQLLVRRADLNKARELLAGLQE